MEVSNHKLNKVHCKDKAKNSFTKMFVQNVLKPCAWPHVLQMKKESHFLFDHYQICFLLFLLSVHWYVNVQPQKL